ncbi:hypothetical protein K2X85_15970 [bacterium]|nr:hypothetical protein [bacterium]
MWLVLWAILAPPDPNATYQSLDRSAKERIYLVYDREVKARQRVDESVDATAGATRYDGGVVRLVVSELKRDGKFLEERKIGPTPKPPKRRPNQTAPVNNRRANRGANRPQRNPNAQRKEYTGDGIEMDEGQEKIKFNSKTYKWYDFRRMCTVALGEKFASIPEKTPIFLDGVVTAIAKHWIVVDVRKIDGETGPSVVILKPPSTKSLKGLHKDDPVRLWGWLADESQIKAAEDAYSEEDEPTATSEEEEEEEDEKKSSTEKQRPAGIVFFAMDIDQYRKEIPGLTLSAAVTPAAGTDEGKEMWQVEVTAKNDGTQKIVHLEVEATVVITDIEKNTKDPEDSALVYFASLEPGASATVKTKIENWTGSDDEVSAIARAINGRAAKAAP